MQQATVSELVTGWGSSQTMPTTKVALYQQTHMINKLNHLTVHIFKEKRPRLYALIVETPMSRPLQVKSTLMVDMPPGMAGYESKSMVMYKEEPLIQSMHDVAQPAVEIPKM